MLYNIKNIIMYGLILFFMYVIILREPIKEGWGIKDLGRSISSGFNTAIDYTKDSTTATYNNIKDGATQITEDVIGEVTGILGGALDGLATNVTKLDTTFRSADQNLANTANISTNFKQDVINSIRNSTTYAAPPNIRTILLGGRIFGGGGIGRGSVTAVSDSIAKAADALAAAKA
jgi:hypothetical protein